MGQFSGHEIFPAIRLCAELLLLLKQKKVKHRPCIVEKTFSSGFSCKIV